MGETPRGVYTWFDVMGASILNLPPLTEDEPGNNFDKLSAYNHPMTEFIARDEFIENALTRESDLLTEELGIIDCSLDETDSNGYV